MGSASPLRVLVDVNVFVSYLLFPDRPGSTIGALVDAALAREFVLLLPEDLLDELLRTLTTKPYLASRIAAADAAAFVASLRSLAVLVPPVPDPAPIRSRDQKDDYLLACSFAAGADYLVSGDDDLLALADIVPWTTIVGPSDFLHLLRAELWP